MKIRFLSATILSLTVLFLARLALALDGQIYIHDPSTIMECDGKYYTFGTGRGGLISEDGWTWHSGAERPGGGVAPDVIHIGDRYYVTYAKGGGGLAGGHASNVYVMWTKTLDPQSPDFGFKDETIVASTDGEEDCDAIDSAFLLDPTDGRLWLTYGTYFGFIRIVELDPETGKRMPGNEPVNIAIDCEATALMYRDGWYYLLGTHGTCCSGVNSTYNIRVGRSRNVTGPYLDNLGMDMLRGGGKLVIAANGRGVGPGHFGLIDLGDDVQKFSFHYEADLDRSGYSVLAIRPLLWEDGWPVAGEDFMGGTFEIESKGSGYALEMGVEAVPLFIRPRRGVFRGFGPAPDETVTPIPDQDVAEVSQNWPDKPVVVRLGDYMLQAHQKWTITPVTDAGGYLGAPCFKITIAGTDRTLTATGDGEVIVEPAYTGDDKQLWRIDQLIDGSYRIMPRFVCDTMGPLALTAVGVTTPSLARFDPGSDRGRWNFKKP